MALDLRVRVAGRTLGVVGPVRPAVVGSRAAVSRLVTAATVPIRGVRALQLGWAVLLAKPAGALAARLIPAGPLARRETLLALRLSVAMAAGAGSR